MNKSYRGLLSLLMESHELLQEGPLNPAQMKAKIGIGKDKFSDENMQKLMDITEDKKQLVSLVRFALETNDLKMVMQYGQKMVELDPKLDPQRFTSFKLFSEFIDAKANAGAKPQGDKFDLDAQEPDWKSSDGRYRVYDAKDLRDCIKYGHGQTFCISRGAGGNMYNYYRANNGSKFYFVFDTKLQTDEETYITVVDAHPDGKYEFTHKSNDTPTSSQRYDFDLDRFLASKPGLAAAKNLFAPAPLSDDEKAWFAKAEQVDQDRTFHELTPQEQLRFIQLGRYDLTFPDFQPLSPELKNEYINHGLEMEEEMFDILTPGQKARVCKVQLDNHTVKEKFIFFALDTAGKLSALEHAELKNTRLKFYQSELEDESPAVQRMARYKDLVRIPIKLLDADNMSRDQHNLVNRGMIDVRGTTIRDLLPFPANLVNSFLHYYRQHFLSQRPVALHELMTFTDKNGQQQPTAPQTLTKFLDENKLVTSFLPTGELDPAFYQLPDDVQDSAVDPIIGDGKMFRGRLEMKQVYAHGGAQRVKVLLETVPTVFPVPDIVKVLSKMDMSTTRTIMANFRENLKLDRDGLEVLSDYQQVQAWYFKCVSFPMSVHDFLTVYKVGNQHNNLSKAEGEATRKIAQDYLSLGKYDKADFQRNHDRLPEPIQQWLFNNA